MESIYVLEPGSYLRREGMTLKVVKEGRMVDNSEDTVRYYFLCKGCLDKMEFSGVGESPHIEKYKVV